MTNPHEAAALLRTVASLAVAAAAVCACADEPSHYNFVVIMADDLGPDELGSYGNTSHHTPNLDRLAAQGMRFQTAYATPLCTPSRVMIMTGRYGFRTGWYNFTGRPGSPTYEDPDYDLGEAELTFADILRSAGYATALAGKWQIPQPLERRVVNAGFATYRIWAWPRNSLPIDGGRAALRGARGRSRFWQPVAIQDGELLSTRPDDYGPDLYADFLIEFIREHRHERFLAYLPMTLVHRPWAPTPVPGRPGLRTRGGLRNNVEYMDHVVGRLVTALDRMGLRENTVVLFTSDNATQGRGKADATEQGARVPLIVSAPGTVAEGVVSAELVDLTDILPTLADFAGASLPADRVIDGRSLRPTLEDPAVPHRAWIFSYLHDDRVLRTRRWLLETHGDRLYDTGGRHGGRGYEEVGDSSDPEVVAARRELEGILEELPAPTGLEPCPHLERHRRRQAGGPEAPAVPRDADRRNHCRP